MNEALRFATASLAVWRLTHLLAIEDGPADLLKRFRALFSSRVLTCFFCLSLWIAIPFAFFVARTWIEIVVCWLALSGAAVLLERATHRETLDLQVLESENELLRRDDRKSDHAHAKGYR